ncbi:MAG: amidohydrolase family protein [Sphingomonas sp.]
MPSRAELDAAFPDTPVALEWSVHDILLNHAAAVALGMGKDFPDPPKGSTGRYERTPDGEVIIVRDAPANLPKLPFGYEQMKEGVRTILEDFYLEKGVTTVSDLSEPSAFRAEQELRAEGRLPVRIIMNYWARPRTAALDGIGTSGSLDDIVQTGLFTGAGDDWMRLGAIKILLDGAWGTTAAITRPVWNGSSTTWVPGNYGGVTFDQQSLDETVLKAHLAGWQIETHANGDRAQDMILTSYEKAQQVAPRADARARIEHFGNFLVDTTPQQTAAHLARMVRDRVIPSTQTAFLWRLTDVNIHEPGVRFFANRTMIDAGMHPAGGVDTVGTQNFATSPLFSIARSVGRRTKYGGIAHASEAITVLEAIKMFTIWAAEASFIEDTRGTIEVGKLADFAVLDGDPFTTPPDALSDIPVAMTIIDGRIAYRRQ